MELGIKESEPASFMTLMLYKVEDCTLGKVLDEKLGRVS
jgi:hypothetical protein